LRASLDAVARDAAPPPARADHAPGLRDRLRALGYAE